MHKIGTKLLVIAIGVAVSGKPGFLDGDVTISADNSAVVEPIDGTSAHVTLANEGDTTITGAATSDGTAITGSDVESAGEPATELKLTVSVAT